MTWVGRAADDGPMRDGHVVMLADGPRVRLTLAGGLVRWVRPELIVKAYENRAARSPDLT